MSACAASGELRVFVVDDDPSVLRSLERTLQSHGFEVEGFTVQQQRQTERDADARFARLTRREQQVCELVAHGLMNKQIASLLGIVEKTIKVHRGRAMHKLEVTSVAALVRLLGNRT
jgi:FixJ family two-component response regulator